MYHGAGQPSQRPRGDPAVGNSAGVVATIPNLDGSRMSRDDGGHWLPIHTGLLDDERFTDSGFAREAWLVLYLQLDREPDPGWFRDLARVRFILQTRKVARADAQIKRLQSVGWLIPETDDSPRFTIKGWLTYTGQTSRKAVHNRDRATTREGRGDRRAPLEKGGDLEKTRRDEKPGRASAQESGAAESPPPTKEEAARIWAELERKGIGRGVAPLHGRPGPVVE